MTDQNTLLGVIDATLAGEPVGPEHAELAELALILSAESPAPRPEFAAELDRRVQRRFVAAAPPRTGGRQRSRWLFAPGGALAVAAVLVLIVVVSGGGAAGPPRRNGAVAVSAPSSNASGSTSASAASSRGSSIAASTSSTPSVTAAGSLSGAPTPVSPGRKEIQSSQLSLSARPDQVESVAQQVFNVVSAEKGYVSSSTVTATGHSDGYAQFELIVPSASLSPALAALSQLRGARVVSRTDSTQDVTGQLGGDGTRLAEDRALRTSLLRQLAAATTSTAVASLKAQIRDADASISSELLKLRRLQHQVDYSQISLTLNANLVPVHSVSGGGFTLGRAAHDAGRVLVVAAGGALIALAALVPVALLVAVGLWMAALIRRRRREQVLDVI